MADDVSESPDVPELPRMSEEVAHLQPPVSSGTPKNTPTGYTEDEDDAEFGPRYSLKESRQVRALNAFMRSGKIKRAIEAAGVTYGAWYRWIEDPNFARALGYARRMLVSDLEDVALERAKEGSDTLVMFLLRAHDEKFKDKQTIVVVSAEVQTRLQQQADAILDVCKEHLDPSVSAIVASALANRFREIWTT